MPWRRRRAQTEGITQTVTGTTVEGNLTMIGQIDNATFEMAGREFRLAPFSADGGSRLSVEWARVQPSRLLEARRGVVAFAGRTSELERLRAWRDAQDGSSISVFLVHAEGGVGKTRLAGHFAQASQGTGWEVWRVTYDQAASLVPLPASLGTGRERGILLVIDYAERWPLAQLAALLRDRLVRRSGPTVRVLLVSRSAGSWWDSLTDMLRQEDIDDHRLALLPLPQGEQSAEELFVAARDRFAEVMQVGGREAIGVPDLSHRDYRLVLTVHMAALAAVDARLRGESPPDDPAWVSAYLLRRERHAWGSLAPDGAGRARTSAILLGRTVYTAVLTGPLSYRDGVRALTQLQIASSPESAASVLHDHGLLYPSHEPGTVMEPLYPDRLAEDFLALSTPAAGLSSSLADPWVRDAPWSLLATQGEDTPARPWDRPAITTLIAAAQRWPHIAASHLYPLLCDRPSLALAAGGAALVSLAERPDIDPAVLEAIEPHLPVLAHVELDLAAAVLTQRLFAHRLPAISDPAVRAEQLATLGWRYGNAGMYEQAVASTKEAATLYRQLAAEDPPAHLRNLGRALGRLSSYEAHAGQRQEAVANAQAAVMLWRRLDTANPADHRPDLARSLGNLGQRLSDVEQHTQALALTEEAVAIQRPLAEADPDAQRSGLAYVLSSYAAARAAAAQELDQALTAAQEASGIYLPMAEQAPETYARFLTTALDTELDVLEAFGRLAVTDPRIASLPPPRIALSQPAAPDQLKGLFLVATPILDDPNYQRTVLLIVEHEEDEGTLAVVLNRPTRVPVAQVLPSWGRLAAAPQVVFTGGVVSPNSALCLALAPSGGIGSGPAHPITGDLVLLDLDQPAGAERFTHIRVLAGYGGWAAGAIKPEIEQGAWYLVSADISELLTMNPYLMWEAVVAQINAP